MNKVIFIHIATINNYKFIVDDFMNKIETSGLINEVSEINLCISGLENISTNYFNINNFKYKISYNGSLDQFEFPTLNKLKDYCKNNINDYVLYIHTKGISDPDNLCISDWRNYMTYFLIEKYKECFLTLENFETCGVDYHLEPSPHYSGNFWWAKASHINNLSEFIDMPTILTERHKAEFWVASKSNQHKSLWNSNINVMERHLHRYIDNMYKDIK